MLSISKGTGEGTVKTKAKKIGTESTKKSTTDPVPTDGTKVGFTMGYTKNLGNFESVRVEVSLTLPTMRNKHEIEEAYVECKAWADAKLTEAVKEIELEVGE